MQTNKNTNAGKEKEELEINGISKNVEVITSVSKTIRTLEQALKAAKTNLSIWEVEKYTINKWDSARKTSSDQWDAIELWQVKVFLRRKIDKSLTDAAESLIRRMKLHAPKYSPIKYPNHPKKSSPHMLELSLMDIHMGKLCWGAETGQDYDLKIARNIVLGATRKLLERAKTYYVEKIIIPVGNDYYQVNNAEMTTTKGTPQDSDGRLAKIFDVGCITMVEVIDMCLGVAPVEVLWVPGNHDTEISRYLSKYLEAWYHKSEDVKVDSSPTPRKAICYGSTLIAFTHGNKEPHRDLPAIMAGEWPELWAKSRFRQWHIGHYHKKKEMFTKIGDTYGAGVETKVLPSLSGLDAWHSQQGYMSNRAAEAHLFSLHSGPVAYFSVSVSELEKAKK